MNRNILVEADFPEWRHESSGVAAVPHSGPDDYFGRLVKYVPVEIIGAYLLVSGLLDTAYGAGGDGRTVALAVLFVVGAVAAAFYARRVLNVVRTAQLAMTVVAFVVWVFAIGGVFATGSWWHPWMGSIAVVVFGVLVKIIGLGPLPAGHDAQGEGLVSSA